MADIFDLNYGIGAQPKAMPFYSDPFSAGAVNVGGALNGSILPDIGASTASRFMANNPMAGMGGGAVGTGALAVGRPDFFSLDGFLGRTNADGSKTNSWGGAALGLIQGLGSAYMGMKQYGLAKEQLQFSKDSFNKNYEAQKSMTNVSMEDRQRARVASNAGAYQSVGDYMAKNGIK